MIPARTSISLTFLFPPGTGSQAEESDVTLEYKFNLTGHVKYKAGLEVSDQTSAMALGEDSANLSSPGVAAASTGVSGCQVFIIGINWTGTGNDTQRAGPRKWHRFLFHGGDERAEENAASNAPAVPPCATSPESTLGTGGADPARPCWQLLLAPELHLQGAAWPTGPWDRTCHIPQLRRGGQMLRWPERDSWGSAVQLPAPRQSRGGGGMPSRGASFSLWTVSHLSFCLLGCDRGTLQTNVTEEKAWIGESPQPCGCRGGAGGVLREKKEL